MFHTAAAASVEPHAFGLKSIGKISTSGKKVGKKVPGGGSSMNRSMVSKCQVPRFEKNGHSVLEAMTDFWCSCCCFSSTVLSSDRLWSVMASRTPRWTASILCVICSSSAFLSNKKSIFNFY